MQYTEKELQKLIQEVEFEFTAHLAKAEENFSLAKSEDAGAAQPAPLAKAEDEKPAEDKKEEKPSEDKAEDKAEAKEESKEESKEAPKADAAPAKEEGEAAAPAEAKPEAEAAAPEANGEHGYDAEDMAHLEKMYMSMSKSEQLIHHDVLRKCMDASAAAEAPVDKCGDMSMSKSEDTKVEAKPVEVKAEDVKASPELEMAKSEAAAANAKAEQLQKSLDTVQEFLTKLVKKVPQGKAITSYEQVAKSEGSSTEEKQLSKGEVDSILNKKAADPNLSKSDREAINAFYLSGANINTISHLLK